MSSQIRRLLPHPQRSTPRPLSEWVVPNHLLVFKPCPDAVQGVVITPLRRGASIEPEPTTDCRTRPTSVIAWRSSFDFHFSLPFMTGRLSARHDSHRGLRPLSLHERRAYDLCRPRRCSPAPSSGEWISLLTFPGSNSLRGGDQRQCQCPSPYAPHDRRGVEDGRLGCGPCCSVSCLMDMRWRGTSPLLARAVQR